MRSMALTAVLFLVFGCSSESSPGDGNKKDGSVSSDGSGGGSGSGGSGGSGGSPDGGSGDSPASTDSAPAVDGSVQGDTPSATGARTVYVAGSNNIYVFTLDMATGVLTAKGMTALSKVGHIATDSQGKYVYGITDVSPPEIIAYSRNAATGALTMINTASAAGNTKGGTSLAVHPGDKWLTVSHYASGHVSVFPVRTNGGVDPPADTQLAGPMHGAHHTAADASGKYLFVPSLGDNWVAQYSINATTGKLTANSPATVTVTGTNGPRHMAFHPNQKFAYVINESNGTMTSFKFDAATGKLSDGEVVSTVPVGVASEGATSHVEVAPSGKFVYGGNRGHESVVIYSVNETTGRLTLVAHQTGINPQHFTIDPTGKYLVVANCKAPTGPVVYEIGTDGKLTEKNRRSSACSDVLFSPPR